MQFDFLCARVCVCVHANVLTMIENVQILVNLAVGDYVFDCVCVHVCI